MARITISLVFMLVLTLFPRALPARVDIREFEQIKSVVIEMWTAVERGDVEGYLEHIHPEYTLFGEGDIYLQEGKDLERASYTDYLDRYENIRTFMHQPQVTVRGDMAWITYYWSDSGYNKKSGERFTSGGKSTRIFVRENGRWLCIHGHFTLVE